jgi:hypothetical protein
MPRFVSPGFRNGKCVALLVLAMTLGYAGAANADPWLVGDLTTYNQGVWGAPASNVGATLLLAKFDTVYAPTGGVIVGSTSGFTMAFTDASSVLTYEPSVGPYAPLNSSVLNPVTTSSGAFGGDVLALEFNVDFSDAGLLPGTSGLRFGDLVLAGFSTFPQLNGLTVRQFLGDMNTLLSGGSSIISISELQPYPLGGAFDVNDLNSSFSNGIPSQFAQDHLVAPSPELTVPAAQTAYANVDKAISGITIGDDASATLTVTLGVSHGTLTLGTTSGLTVTGNGTGSATLMGTTANLNADLATLVYRASHDYSGSDTLSITATDDRSVSATSASVAINVVSIDQQIANLQAQGSALQTAGVLNQGQANSLIVKLNLKGNNGDSGKVQAFLNEVQADLEAGILTQAQADALLGLGDILLASVTGR